MAKPSNAPATVVPVSPTAEVHEEIFELALIPEGGEDDKPPSAPPVRPATVPHIVPNNERALEPRASPAPRPKVNFGVQKRTADAVAEAHRRLFQELALLTQFKIRKRFIVWLVAVSATVAAGGVGVAAYFQEQEAVALSVAEVLQKNEVQIITDPALMKGIEYIHERIKKGTYRVPPKDKERLASALISAEDRDMALARSEEAEKLALHESVIEQHVENAAEQAKLSAEAAEQAKADKQRDELAQKAAERERLAQIEEQKSKPQLTPEQISGAFGMERRLTGGMTTVTGAEDQASVENQGKALAEQLKAWKSTVKEK